MASQLDREINAVMDRLAAPGGPLETAPVACGSVTLPAFIHAPPSLPALFAAMCAKHGDATFIVDGDVRLTFGEVHALASRAAAGLIVRHGLSRGERVGIAARNSASWIVAYMAALMAGGCATLLNGWWSGDELAQGIALTGCKLVLADAERAERIGGRLEAGAIVPLGHGDPRTGLAALIADEADTALPELAGDDLATILFTSGSTGVPRGAWSNHRSVVQATMSYAGLALMVMTWLTERGEAPVGQPAILVNIPLFHVTGEIPLLLQSFALGRKLVIMPKWDAREAMRLIEAERITYFLGVPLMSYEIATHPDRESFDLSSCATLAAGGAPRPAEHVARLREALPHAFPLLGYGLTETNAVGCGNFHENYLAKPGSTGPAHCRTVQLAIFGVHGDELPAGETGEVALRSVANFGGYWNDPAATAAAVRPDGYFLTGDLGYIDDDGYLFIVDRKKDIVIRGGENIACIDVEQAIFAHPAIAEACVFGMPDERFGEVPAAVYVARHGEALAPGELREFLGARIAAFKVPAYIWQEFAPLPRLGTEKIDRRALKARYANGNGAAKGD